MEAYSKIDTEALKEFLTFVGSYTVDLIYNPGDLTAIYHYTDLNGLKGIIDSHDLWLTHSRYSNDDEELTHGFQIVRRVTKEELTKEIDPAREDFLKQLSAVFETPKSEGIYICCFCAKDNLLSQWRSYGANGTGVSLSFDPARFDYITGPDSPPSGLIRLWKVFYKEATQCEIVRNAINFYWNKLHLSIEERVRHAVDAIQFFVPTFKNEDFAEEDEIRLIFTPLPNTSINPQFRVARGMLIPYYSLKELTGSTFSGRTLPLLKVRIGPSANKELNIESARMLLVKASYKNVLVETSNTPYRG